jgi:hypothetical protein
MANLDKILLNNTFTLPAGFNIDSTEPIDSRFQVNTKEDLYKDWGNAKVTNKDGVNEAIYKYDGLITYVKSEGKSYRYNSSLLSDENLKGWELVPVLSDIPNAPVQGISVDGVEIEPDENGIVNITFPDVDGKITSAIEDLDSTISVESGFLTGITIEDGKLVSYTSDTIPEVHVPEYTILKSTNDTSTEYQLKKDGASVGDTIIVPKSEITFKDGDIYIAEKQVLITSDLDDYLVKDIKDGDLLLSLNSDGEVSSKIELKYEPVTKTVVDSEGKESKITYQAIRLYGQNDEEPLSEIDCTDFIKDGFLETAEYNTNSHILTLTWNTDSGIKTPTEIDLNGLIDVHDVVGGDAEGDLVKIVVDEKNENGVLTFTVSIDETNLQNKLDEIDGKFIKSVEDNDTATYVKVNTNTVDQAVTISVDESELTTKLTEIDNKFSEIDGKFVESVDAPELDKQDTLVKVKVDNTDSQKPVISLDDSALDTKFDDLDTKFDDYLPYEKIATGEVSGDFINISLNVDENKELSVSFDETKLNERFEALVDADTKCTLATINVAEATTPVVDEVDVIAKQNIVLKGETGESLETEQPISSVKVVTKQYVESKFAEVPTYTAITNDEIDALFV